MRAAGHESARSWVDALGVTEFALNSSVSDATGVSPFFAVYAKDVRAPVDCLDGLHANDAAQRDVRAREQLARDVRARILRAQAQQKRYADRKRRDVTF